MNSINTTRLRLRALAIAVAAAALLPAAMVNAQTISTVAGNGSGGAAGDGAAATAASIGTPEDIAHIPAGGYYISASAQVRKVDSAGLISSIAGNGTEGFSGDGGPATLARLGFQVTSVNVSSDGSLLLTDVSNFRVRKISAAGIITTIAGNGSSDAIDGGAATASGLATPTDAISDAAGNIFIAEFGGCRVRKVTPAGVISTVVGTGTCTSGGDGGPATVATLRNPWGLAFNASGELFVSEYSGDRIRKIDASGVITTVNGSVGLGGPLHIDFDSAGNLYAAGFNVSRVSRVTPAGVQSVIAGTTGGFSGDGGPATAAQLQNPRAATVAVGHLLIADTGNNRVRKVVADVAPLLTAALTCAESGFTGSKLTLCRRICEVINPPATQTSLIRFYTAIYREAPPCGI